MAHVKLGIDFFKKTVKEMKSMKCREGYILATDETRMKHR